jgi:hypothetical protein
LGLTTVEVPAVLLLHEGRMIVTRKMARSVFFMELYHPKNSILK